MCLQTFKLSVWNATYRNSIDIKRQGFFRRLRAECDIFARKISESLSRRFKKLQYLFAFARTRVNRAQMPASLHFPDRRDVSLFFYRVI